MRIPTAERQVMPQGALTESRVQSFGVQQSGMTILGNALQDTGVLRSRQEAAQAELNERALREQQRRELEDDRLTATNAMTEFRMGRQQALEESLGTVEPGAPDFAKNYNASYEDALKQAAETMPNTQAKTFFELEARQFQTQQFNEAITAEVAERQRYRTQALVDGAEAESAEIGMATDTVATWESLVPNRIDMINKSAISPKAKQAAIDASTRHFSRSMVIADGQNNPQMAIERIDSGFYHKLPGFNMYDDQLQQMRRNLESKANVKDMQLVANIKDAYNQWTAEVVYGTNAVKEMPLTDEQIKFAYGPEGYNTVKDNTATLQAVMPYMSGLALKSPEEVAKITETLKNDSSRATVWSKQVELINEKYQQILSERESNPGLALDNMTKLSLPANASMSDKLGAKAILAVDAGMPMANLLSNEEVKSTVAQITAGNAQQTERQLARFMEDLDVAGEVSYKLKSGEVVNKSIKNIVMEQMYANGKNGGGLDRKYMVAEFAKGSNYHQFFIQAIKEKDVEGLKQRLGPVAKQVSDQLKANTSFSLFRQHIDKAADFGAGELLNQLYQTVETAALLASQQGKPMTNEVVKDLIDNRYHMGKTYFAPKEVAATVSELDDRLNYLKNNMVRPNGVKIDVNINSSNAILNGTPTAENMRKNADNFVWLTDGSGDGLYMAQYLPNAGQYMPVLDKSNSRIFVPFSQLSRMEKHGRGGSAPKYRLK
jgi:hypothetical protein